MRRAHETYALATAVRQHILLHPISIGAISLATFAGYLGFLRLHGLYPSASLAGAIAAALLCAAISRVSYDGVPTYVRTLARGLGIACGLYNFALFPGFPILTTKVLGLSEGAVLIAWLAAALAALLSWRRPSGLLFCAYYTYWIKQTAGLATGFDFHTWLDIAPLYQIPAYLAISILGLSFANRQGIKLEEYRWRPVAVIAIAMQAANYFLAGLAKATIDGPPLEWPLRNENWNLLLVALHNKQLLWSEIPGLAPLATTTLSSLGRPLAVAIFVCQLSAIAVFANKRLAIASFAFFDLMHLGIFALAGANFWTWFMVNMAVISAVAGMPPAVFGLRMASVGALLIAATPKLLWVAPLAWYDTRAINTAYFEVEDAEGTRTRVPSTFFGFYSYPIAHMSFGLPPGEYLPTGTNGNTLSWKIKTEAEACSFSSHTNQFGSLWSADSLQTFLSGYHAYVLRRANDNGKWPNALYPHHFWSAISVEQKFASVDLRTIRRYRLVVESVCLNRSGAVERTLFKNEHPFDLP